MDQNVLLWCGFFWCSLCGDVRHLHGSQLPSQISILHSKAITAAVTWGNWFHLIFWDCALMLEFRSGGRINFLFSSVGKNMVTRVVLVVALSWGLRTQHPAMAITGSVFPLSPHCVCVRWCCFQITDKDTEDQRGLSQCPKLTARSRGAAPKSLIEGRPQTKPIHTFRF